MNIRDPKSFQFENLVNSTLILAAHGSSSRSVNSEIHQLSALVKQQCKYSEVLTAIHRSEKNFSNILDDVKTDSVHVIPLMTSGGYFSTQVLPQALLESGRMDERNILVSQAIGENKSVPRLVSHYLSEVIESQQLSPANTSLLIVGHGTPRNKNSRASTYKLKEQLQCSLREKLLGVEVAFIEEAPKIETSMAKLEHKNVIVFPFLISGGEHYQVDIPESLGIAGNEGKKGIQREDRGDGTAIVLTPPFGRIPGFEKIIVQQSLQMSLRHSPSKSRASFLDFERISRSESLTSVLEPNQIERPSVRSKSGQKVETKKKSKLGHVYLVGAGIGDEKLISRKGFQILRKADVVVHDRLISPVLLTYIKDSAEVIDAGKSPGNHKLRQNEICDVIIKYAKQGKKVLRLKGGDPFVFGRGGEESDYCEEHGIPVSVVPGISSALAAPLAAGIPVTRRGVSSSVAISSGELGECNPGSAEDFFQNVNSETVVTLMGRRKLRSIMDSLHRSGRSSETPVCCIENAYLPTQRTVRGTIETIADIADAQKLSSPMVVITGKVAKFGKTSDPFSNSVKNGGGNSTHQRPNLVGVSVAITHPRSTATQIVRKFYQAGANVLVTPIVEHVAFNRPHLFDQRNDQANQIVLFDSSLSVRFFAKELKKQNKDWRIFRQVAAVGKSARRELEKLGIQVDQYFPSKFTVSKIAKKFAREMSRESQVVVPFSKQKSQELSIQLELLGFRINSFPAFLTKSKTVDRVHLDTTNRKLDVVVFSSPESVDSWQKQKLPATAIAVCQGKDTKQQATKHGFNAIQISNSSFQRTVEEIRTAVESPFE